MTTLQFESHVAVAIERAAAVAEEAGAQAVPLELFLYLLVKETDYVRELVAMTGASPDEVAAVFASYAEKRDPAFKSYLTPDAVLSHPRVEEANLEGDVEIVLANAAIHVYGAGRANGLIDGGDILISAFAVFEERRAPVLSALSHIGFTALAVKLCDRDVHGAGGLVDQARLSGSSSAMLQQIVNAVIGDEDEEPYGSEPAEGDSLNASSEPSIDLDDYRDAIKEALGRLSKSDFADSVRRMMDGKAAVASFVMNEKGDLVPAAEFFGNGKAAEALPGTAQSSNDDADAPRPGRDMTREEKVLARYTRDLTAAAERGEIDPLVGRRAELTRICEILHCRRKNKPLIIGESGTGKTALAEGLARAIVQGEVPPHLRHTRLFALQTGALISRYKGVFGERLAEIGDAVKRVPGGMLFIDDIHAMVDGADESASEQMNAILRLVSDDDLRIVASTSFGPWRKTLSKNDAVTRRFQPVELAPVSEEEAQAILRGIAPQYEAYHGVRFADGLLERIVTLSNRYILDRSLPEKAVEVMDELAAVARLHRETDDQTVIDVTDAGLPAVISRIARVPVDQVGKEEGEALAKLDSRLKGTVFGQDSAIDAVVAAIKMSRSGLGSAERPVGSFLFTGPTGVGKTEVARQLAGALGIPMLRFDMSEYSESHTVSRLIGSPAGYVGYNDGGLLTDRVTKQPYSVVLLDEIEKAHPTLFNLLLQVMDHGKLTDASGREADFRNVILIMTSNVGARALERNTIGFGRGSEGGDESAALRKAFTPEFRNRLDAIVRFSPLSHETLAAVVDKFLGELSGQLALKNVKAVYTPAFRAWLAQKGYDPHMGARPMRRLIADEVRRKLADELLFGSLTHGGTVTADVKDDAVSIVCEASEGATA